MTEGFSDKPDGSDTDRNDGQLRAIRPVPRWAIIGLFLYGTVFTLSYAKSFFVPVVLAILLALVFSPIRRVFDRRGIPSALTSLTIVVGLLAGMIVIFGALALPVTGWIERAPEISNQVRDQLSNMSAALSEVFDAFDRLTSLTAADPDVERIAVESSSPAIDIATLIPGILGQFVFTLVLLFFLLASGDMFHEKLVHVMPSFHDKRQAVRVARDIERKLSRYLLTITIINAGLGVVVGLAMWLMGMPSPIVFGVIAFIFNYVPFLGAVAGVVIASAVALVSFDWVGWAPIVGGVYFACTTFEGQFVTPYFVGRNLRLNIVMVFLAVTFWAWLWSAIGMIVAVPLLAALRTIASHIDGMKGLADFFGERHSETSEDREGEP